MKVRIVYKPDKSVAVIHPAPKSKRENETEDQWLERVFNKVMQEEFKDLPYDDMDVSELPQLGEDRNAWEGEKGKGISINQDKARAFNIAKQYKFMIEEKKREIAINELIKEGKLPADY